MHLSAPPETMQHKQWHDKGGFSLHYAAIDDAVSIVQQLGSGMLSAKIDIKF